MLIHCSNKAYGENISSAIQEAIDKKYKKISLQQFYSSEASTPEARNEEEKQFKEKAGENRTITVSSVFGRGTDIKPTHEKGLYVIDTFVDTQPYSAEDLERAKRQKIGRGARGEQEGVTRLIVRRSEFLDVYNIKDMRNIPSTTEGLDKAISELNNKRNQIRTQERESRESFDDIKQEIYEKFFKFIEVINASYASETAKQAIRTQLFSHWNLFLRSIDDEWENVQHEIALKGNYSKQIEKIAELVCTKWTELIKDQGSLVKEIGSWQKFQKITSLSLPQDLNIEAKNLNNKIFSRHKALFPYYVKRQERYGTLDNTLTADKVYCDLNSSSDALEKTVQEKRKTTTQSYINTKHNWLNHPTQKYLLGKKFELANKPAEVKKIMDALLYLRYKAYRENNGIGYAKLSNECRRFTEQIIWSGESTYKEDIAKAYNDHFTILTKARGSHEARKQNYLGIIMAESSSLLPDETNNLKTNKFDDWRGNMLSQAKTWLSQYQDKWMTRSWVSNDRKVVANALYQALDKAEDPKVILQAIATARKTLLRDDKEYNRSLDSSINGRLYQYLNELENKVQAAMTPQQLDENVDIMFKNMSVVLASFDARYPETGLGTYIENINGLTSYNEKYQCLITCFKNISTLMDKGRIHSKEWQLLRTHSQYLQGRMDNYLLQCKESRSVKEQPSVRVYHALSGVAHVFFQHIMHLRHDVKLSIPWTKFTYKGEKFTYKGENVNFKREDTIITNNAFFLKVNQEATYVKLLSSLEACIIEKLPEKREVKFTEIALGKSSHYISHEKNRPTGFKLKVSMTINEVEVAIELDLNMHTGSLHTEMKLLQILDEQVDLNQNKKPGSGLDFCPF